VTQNHSQTRDQAQIHFFTRRCCERFDDDIREPGARGETFQSIENEHEDARRFAQDAEYVRRANVPAPDAPDIDPFALATRNPVGIEPSK